MNRPCNASSNTVSLYPYEVLGDIRYNLNAEHLSLLTHSVPLCLYLF